MTYSNQIKSNQKENNFAFSLISYRYASYYLSPTLKKSAKANKRNDSFTFRFFYLFVFLQNLILLFPVFSSPSKRTIEFVLQSVAFVPTDLADTNEKGGRGGKIHIYLSGVQNHGEKRCSVDNRPLDELRNRHMAPDGPSTGALDSAWRSHDLPIVRLNLSSHWNNDYTIFRLCITQPYISSPIGILVLIDDIIEFGVQFRRSDQRHRTLIRFSKRARRSSRFLAYRPPYRDKNSRIEGRNFIQRCSFYRFIDHRQKQSVYLSKFRRLSRCSWKKLADVLKIRNQNPSCFSQWSVVLGTFRT